MLNLKRKTINKTSSGLPRWCSERRYVSYTNRVRPAWALTIGIAYGKPMANEG